MNTDIQLTLVGHADLSLAFGKRLSLDAEGQITKDTQANLTKGTAQRITLDSGKPYGQLAALKEGLPVHQAMVGGVYAADLPDEVPLGMKGNRPAEGIARTKADLPWRRGAPGVMTIDCDGGGEGERTPNLRAPTSRESFKPLIETVAPGICEGFTLAESSGAGLYAEGVELTPANRWHFQTLVQDASDIPRALEAMHVRLFLDGHGWMLITTAGDLLPRSPVDLAMRTPNQPVFGPPELGKGLERRVGPPEVVEGPLFDSRKIPALSGEERARYADAVAEMKAKVRKDHKLLIDRLKGEAAKRISEQSGISLPLARKQLDRRDGKARYLIGQQQIQLDNGTWVSANEILAKPEKYHEETCHDPVEPDLGSCKAVIYTDDNPTPVVHSLAHGMSTTYRLRMDVKGFAEMMANKPPAETGEIWATEAARIVDDSPVARDQIVAAMEGLLGSRGRQVIKTELKAADEEVRDLLRTAQAEESKAQARQQARQDRHLFQEWDPTRSNVAIENIQKHLGGLEEDPLMLHSNGLVIVREGSPAYVEGESGAKPPPILKLRRVEQETIRQLIERNVVLWRGGKQIPIPDKLANGVLKAQEYYVPQVANILEHPIVRHDGSILYQRGLHRESQIFMSPSMGPECLPTDFSQEAAAAALTWLKEEFLEGFPFATPLDADNAVGMLLTAMQRALLVAAPGGIIDGSNRAVGKTALAQMQRAALTGRFIPAIALPRTEDEIEKRLVAVLLEGREEVLFDNVEDGRVISSESLAACITGEGGAGGRILGSSEMMESNGRIMVYLTGVNIRTKGDFNTRFLLSRLESDTSNPEKTTYKRPDLKAWVMARQTEILRNCLTIVAGYQRAGRPKVPGGSTRFKQWGYMVRDPIIWAGGLDITQAFDRNREEDQEEVSQTQFVSALYEWQESREKTGEPWLAKDVIETIGVAGEEVEHQKKIREAFHDLWPGGHFEATSFGKKLCTLRGRGVGGLVVRDKGKGKGGKRWLVEQVVGETAG